MNSGGERLYWHEVPLDVRRGIEADLGAPVVVERSQPGGFSPGLASRLRLGDGRRIFVKAVARERNLDSPELHRREIAVMAVLPDGLPVPRLLGHYDDGDWVAVVQEDVPGVHPAEPWRPDEMERVCAALADLAERLTPSPIPAPPIAQLDESMFRGWRTLALDPRPATALDPWVRDHLDLLADAEARWVLAAAGQTLVHVDVRADNLLLTADRVVVVDWPHARIGASWLDLLFFLPSAAMPGGVDPGRLWATYPPARAAAPGDVTAVLAALTGFFLHSSLLPPPPRLERVRASQRAQGDAALHWLRERLGSGGQ
jgi:hypothetical protein